MTVTEVPTADDVTVLVVEDHRTMREAVAQSVNRADGFAVAATAGSGQEALAALDAGPIDIVIVDLSLPDMSGSELIAAIGRSSSRALCLVLSGHREPHYIVDARAVGARGYVVKGRPREVVAALRAVAAGQEYFRAGAERLATSTDQPSSE
jgi:two-component system nitrate/nitrite response regulator NarL